MWRQSNIHITVITIDVKSKNNPHPSVLNLLFMHQTRGVYELFTMYKNVYKRVYKRVFLQDQL